MPWLKTELAGYMDRMNFFNYVDVEDVNIPDWNRYEHPERLVELTCIKEAGNTDAVADRLADAITGNLTTASPDAAVDPVTGKNEYSRYRHPIWYSLSELLENAVTHARKYGNLQASVWVAAQYYEKNGEVKFSVVDNGCGFLRTLSNHPRLSDKTHLAAIKAALEAKVSCNRDVAYVGEHGNQGVGLTTTMRIAKAAKGRLLIASGTAELETRTLRGQKMPHDGAWQGVAIAFSCRRHALPAVNISNLLPVEEVSVNVAFVD